MQSVPPSGVGRMQHAARPALADLTRCLTSWCLCRQGLQRARVASRRPSAGRAARCSPAITYLSQSLWLSSGKWAAGLQAGPMHSCWEQPKRRMPCPRGWCQANTLLLYLVQGPGEAPGQAAHGAQVRQPLWAWAWHAGEHQAAGLWSPRRTQRRIPPCLLLLQAPGPV